MSFYTVMQDLHQACLKFQEDVVKTATFEDGRSKFMFELMNDVDVLRSKVERRLGGNDVPESERFG